MNGNYLQLLFSTLKVFSLQEAHQIGTAVAGEPNLGVYTAPHCTAPECPTKAPHQTASHRTAPDCPTKTPHHIASHRTAPYQTALLEHNATKLHCTTQLCTTLYVEALILAAADPFCLQSVTKRIKSGIYSVQCEMTDNTKMYFSYFSVYLLHCTVAALLTNENIMVGWLGSLACQASFFYNSCYFVLWQPSAQNLWKHPFSVQD